jgi:hypothetical protein
MPMTIDKARHDDHRTGVNDLGVSHREVGANLRDDAIPYVDVGLLEVANFGVHGDDPAATYEDGSVCGCWGGDDCHSPLLYLLL